LTAITVLQVSELFSPFHTPYLPPFASIFLRFYFTTPLVSSPSHRLALYSLSFIPFLPSQLLFSFFLSPFRFLSYLNTLLPLYFPLDHCLISSFYPSLFPLFSFFSFTLSFALFVPFLLSFPLSSSCLFFFLCFEKHVEVFKNQTEGALGITNNSISNHLQQEC